MKVSTAVLLLTMSINAMAAEGFDQHKPGGLPAGWSTGVTGKGESLWRVESDANAPSKPNVLKQSGVGHL